MSLLEKQTVSVSTDGEIVVFRVGSAEMRMDHVTAIQISTWLRIRGKEAKRNAGDVSAHWSAIGNLKAVEAGERPW
jgi:hypothetical protein